MPEHAGESRFGPAELEREQAESDRDERDAGAGQHEQREPGGEGREASEGDEGTHDERPPAVTLAPLAEAFLGRHATAAPSRSPSLRSR